MRTRIGAVWLAWAALLSGFVLVAPVASADVWIETTEADFLGGALTNVSVTPAGDVTLARSGLYVAARQGMVLDVGNPGDADDVWTFNPFVLRESTGEYKMWYTGYDGIRYRMLFADSLDGIVWTKQGVVIDVLTPPWDFDSVGAMSVLKEGTTYHMWFHGGFWSGAPAGCCWGQIYYATSSDGLSWSIQGPALGLGADGTWDDSTTNHPWVVQDASGTYRLYYAAWDGSPAGSYRIGLATSPTYTNFTRYGSNPILDVGLPGSWEASSVGRPNAIMGSRWTMIYSGSDGSGGRAGLAFSDDEGYTWTKGGGNPWFNPAPPPAWDAVGVGTTAYVWDPSGERMYYVGGDGTPYRIGYALLSIGYVASGTYTSRVFDSGAGGTMWNSLSWNATLPPDTYLSFAVRAGDTPDLSGVPWSSEIDIAGSVLSLPRLPYLQYRAALFSLSGVDTPILHDVTVDYARNAASAPLPQSPADGSWTANPTPTFAWTFTDPEGDSQSGFRVELDNDPAFTSVDYTSGDATSSSESWPSAFLPDGCWYWRVRTQDSFGERGPSSVASQLCIDTLAPTTTLSTIGFTYASGGTTFVTSSNRFALDATDGGIGIDAIWFRTWDGSSWSSWTRYSVPFALAGADGGKYVEYYATDDLSNGEALNNAMFILDDSPPATTPGIGLPQVRIGDTYFVSPVTQFTLTASDGGSGVKSTSFRVDAGPWQSYSGPFDLGAYSGFLVLSFATEDNLANRESFGFVQVFVDGIAPVTHRTLIGPIAEIGGVLYIRSTTSVALAASDLGSGVDGISYRIDGGTLTPFSSPFTIPGEGPHAVAFFATDLLGNVEPLVGMSVVVDDTTPAALLTIASPSVGANPTYVDANSLFTITVQDAASGVRSASYQIDGGAARAYTAPFTLAALSDGPHTISYFAIDNLDNAGPPASTSVYLDTTPPAAEAGEDIAIIEGTAVTFDGSGSFDAGGLVNHTWSFAYGGATITSYGASSMFTFDLLGTFVVTLTVKDRLGHPDSDSLVVTVTTLAPTAQVSVSPGVGNMGTAFRFDGRGSTDADGVVFSWAWNFGDGGTGTGAEASHTFGERGTFVVTLTVWDEDGATDVITLSVTVENRVPTADAGIDRTAVAGDDVALSGAGSRDPDGDALSYRWRQTGGPSVTLIGADAASPTFDPSEAGTYTFELVVNDGHGANATDQVIVVASEPVEVVPRVDVWPWVLAIALIVSATLVALILLSRRRRSPPDQEVSDPKQPEESLPVKEQPDEETELDETLEDVEDLLDEL